MLDVCAVYAEENNKPARTGQFITQFSERHPETSVDAILARVKVKDNSVWVKEKWCKNEPYDLKNEHFWVYVPNDYGGSKPFGLYVYMNPGKKCSLDPGEKALLDKYNLIWVSAEDAGNDLDQTRNFGLAVDAAHNMKKLYNIDPDRIFLIGASGGGRCASITGIAYADVFTGGCFYLIGCNDFATNTNIDKEMVKLAQNRRFVFLTGSEDFNKPGTQNAYKAYKSHGFRKILYIEVPGLGHTGPSPEWLEKGFLFMDRDLKDRVKPIINGVEFKHFKNIDKELCFGKPAASIFKKLEKSAAVEGEEAEEAKKILEMFNTWVEEQYGKFQGIAAENPVGAVSSLQKLAITVGKLEQEKKVEEAVVELLKDKNLKDLMSLLEKKEKFQEKLEEKGEGKTTKKDREKILKDVEKLKKKKELSDAIKEELEAIVIELG
jgi:hypothetical protein